MEAEAPGPLLRRTSDLVDVLADPARLTADLDRVRAFRARFAPFDDGDVSRRVVDELERRGVRHPALDGSLSDPQGSRDFGGRRPQRHLAVAPWRLGEALRLQLDEFDNRGVKRCLAGL